MRNIHGRRGRTQHAPVVAPAFEVADLDGLPSKVAVVHLAPVIGEIRPDVLGHLPRADLTGLTAQGLLRRVAGGGAVQAREWPDAGKFLDAIDVLVLSSEDIQVDPAAGLDYLRRAPTGILTRGSLPVQIFADGGCSEVPVHAVADDHPTGAGDVFAAATLRELAAHGHARPGGADCRGGRHTLGRTPLDGLSGPQPIPTTGTPPAMNFDVLTLAAVRGEIEDRAVGGRIQRVSAPEPNQIGLEIYANRAAQHLLIQAGPVNSRVHFVSGRLHAGEAPASPLLLLLRKWVPWRPFAQRRTASPRARLGLAGEHATGPRRGGG